ncbi:hypothetical protein [Desulfosporosinus hippei]|uniref:hypothetical protein n=1 Tax=Desulfosporosinus hippei TaxID=569859 RepID=UPI0015A0C2EB|nr:hypothetical protein [Desulfosporosinus hippei]
MKKYLLTAIAENGIMTECRNEGLSTTGKLIIVTQNNSVNNECWKCLVISSGQILIFEN